jgi:hypothetical protein
LSLSELTGMSGWWRRTPRQLNGATNPSQFLGNDQFVAQIATIRTRSVVRLVEETLAELDRNGILGRATVFVLSDHGPRGKFVDPELTQHVMLAAFLPGDRRDQSVDEPVSLADIAPTLRARLGLDSPAATGVPLPLDTGTHVPALRPVSVAPRPSPVENLDLWRADPSVLRGLLILEPDGCFKIDESRLRLIAARPPAPAPTAPLPRRSGPP